MAVIGASITKFGQREGEWITDLLAEAGLECLEDAGADADEVESVHVEELREPGAGIREPGSQDWDGYRLEPLRRA